jgi:hypothetical protein
MSDMDIDQRLDAIARNLDTLTKIHLDNDREYRERFDRMSAGYNDRFQRNEQRLAQVMDAMNRLITIVESRQQRLDDLEGGR